MSEQGPRLGSHRSIFIRLVTIMVATAAVLVIVVASMFSLMVEPTLTTSRRLAVEYTRVLAATEPDLQTARRLAASLDLQMRYEGPDGAWETSPGLPSIEEARSRAGSHGLFLAPGPKGGTYLVSWSLGRRLSSNHTKMIWLFLVVVVAVVASAYAALSRSLRPLRSLYQGVTRLSEGQLDVVVPSHTRDEFGVLTEAFNQMVRRIRDMVRTRDQLLLDVSHELRSPLTRIKVALALLPEGEKTQRIAADVAEMEAMITELLELERLRDGRGVRTKRQDLVPILREMAESFEDRPPGVRFVAAASKILVDIDGDKIRTVLRNLLENAVKYSLPDSRPIVVSVAENEEMVVIRVVDDGPGIPETDLASLFEPFFRVDRSRSKKSGGYGLGLSICKRIMEAHGGGIATANNAGRGASFTLTLRKPI
jgi:signal transduction histidine kinase